MVYLKISSYEKNFQQWVEGCKCLTQQKKHTRNVHTEVSRNLLSAVGEKDNKTPSTILKNLNQPLE